jgi:hypothetical protein
MTSTPATFDFDRLFDRQIAPALAPQAAKRRRLWLWYWIGALMYVAAIGALGLQTLTTDGGSYGVGGWAAFGVLLLLGPFCLLWPLEQHCGACKAEILGRLAFALRLFYRAQPALGADRMPGFYATRDLLMLPAYNHCFFEDLFSGVHRGHDFDIYEARLERAGAVTKWKTVFQGQIIRIAFPKRFLGMTVINRPQWRGWRYDGFESVGLPPEFERAFDVFGTDQVEARYLVHPGFMQRLLDLEKRWSGSRLRCVFREGELIIVVEAGNLFEVASVWRPIPDRELTRRGADHIRQLLDVIDQVLDPPRPQWGAAS